MSARMVLEDDAATTLIEPLHVPVTNAERTRGLLGRDGLGRREGMWFQRCRLIHTFGMRFAIDLVYLNEQMAICKIVHRMRPWRLSACLGADSVLELKEGTARELGLSRGTRLKILR